MPPNTGLAPPKLSEFKYYYRELANPYKEERRACFEECSGTRTGFQDTRQLELDLLTENSLRIATRARQTYELYRYDRNAMLILSQSDDRGQVGHLIDRLKTTFERFRFVIQVQYASNTDDFYEKCGQFFQSDFDECGAVALAIVTTMGQDTARRMYTARRDRMFFEESRVMQNFEVLRNPTLADKPKIYITMNDHQPSVNSSLSRDVHGDVLALRVALLSAYDTRSIFRRPNPGVYRRIPSHFVRKGEILDILCNSMVTKCDNKDMLSIMEESVKEYEDKNIDSVPSYMLPGKRSSFVVSTLDKQLYLEKAVEN